MVTEQEMKAKIEALLAEEFYCSVQELNGTATVYSVNIDAKLPYIKILAYKNCVVVCTSENLYANVRKTLQWKSRDEIFELPLVYGQTIHYIPKDGCEDDGMRVKYDCEYMSGKDILTLVGLTGFENSLGFDDNGSTLTEAVYVARDKDRIIGVAGAAKSHMDGVWEIGVDVMQKYRNARLGTYLVKKLTRELMLQNIVPFYSASVTNIGSQMVACRCGYIPIWVDTFGCVLDGSFGYHDFIRDAKIQV